MGILERIVSPGLDDIKLKHALVDDEIRAQIPWELGDLDLIIREVERAELIWIRILTHIFADANESLVMTTALGANYLGFGVKCGRDPLHGEIVIDCELASRAQTKETFIRELRNSFLSLRPALRAIAASSFAATLDLDFSGSFLDGSADTDFHPVPPNLTGVERQVVDFLAELDNANPG